MEREGGRVHEDTAAELVPGFLDDAVDGHFFDVEDGEDGRAEDVHDSLRNLVAWACPAKEKSRGKTYERVYVRSILTGVRNRRQSRRDRARLACRVERSGDPG